MRFRVRCQVTFPMEPTARFETGAKRRRYWRVAKMEAAEGEIATGTLGFDGKNVVVYSTYDVVDDVEEGSG